MNRLATIHPEKSQREKSHQTWATQMASESFVLLKNEGALPFSDDIHSIALLGGGARKSVIGGTGSGAVNVRSFVSIEQGLIHQGYKMTTKAYLDTYDQRIENAWNDYREHIRETAQKSVKLGLFEMFAHPFLRPDIQTIDETMLQTTAADTAVYVVSRISGEGADRKNAKGDFLLSDDETSDLKKLAKHYSSMTVLLNVGGPMDISPILRIPAIKAIVLIGQAGIGMGSAVASMLKGSTTPSGKLSSTWAKHYPDYPSSPYFLKGSVDESHYGEGLYVGYRYFSTFNINPRFPFGFGLSYATFSIKPVNLSWRKNVLSCSMILTNTSQRHSGKEVIQFYVTKPNDMLNTPSLELVGFQKSRNLAPLEMQLLRVRIPLENLSSYDPQTHEWIIQKGIHRISFGNACQKTIPVCEIVAENRMVLESCHAQEHSLVDDLVSPARKRSRFHGPRFVIQEKYVRLQLLKNVEKNDSNLQTQEHYTYDDVVSKRIDLTTFINDLSVQELIALCVGSARVDLSDLSCIGAASKSIPGAAGETSSLPNRKIPSLTMADGPAGIRVTPIIYEDHGVYFADPQDDPTFSLLFSSKGIHGNTSGATKKYQYCTALPIETNLAQTWNTQLLTKAGTLVGKEMKELGIALWLAPGMNIQRNPLCGRNFEYFSEDPFLSGACASALTRGVQQIPGCGVVIKHFACNNQETNRNFNNSIVSTRALREIYLQGFKKVIAEANPFAVMSSYNFINGIHAANNRHLLTEILRNEWHFKGVVMTDWYATSGKKASEDQNGCSIPYLGIKAGNDLMMPGGLNDLQDIQTALENQQLTLDELKTSATRVMELLIRTENETRKK